MSPWCNRKSAYFKHNWHDLNLAKIFFLSGSGSRKNVDEEKCSVVSAAERGKIFVQCCAGIQAFTTAARRSGTTCLFVLPENGAVAKKV